MDPGTTPDEHWTFATEQELVDHLGVELIEAPVMKNRIDLFRLSCQWLITAMNGTYKFSSQCADAPQQAYQQWKQIVSNWK